MKCLRFLVGLTACLAACVAAGADLNSLAAKIPMGANTIVIVNIEKIHASGYGKREGLAEKQQQEFALGQVTIPPDTRVLIAASQLDFEVKKPLWETLLADIPRDVDLNTVEALTGGKMDSVGGLNAVVLPTDAYLVKFPDGVVGAMNPGNRQAVARWASMASGKGAPLAPYLQEAVDLSERVGTEIVLAMDLNAVVHPDRVRMRLDDMAAVEGGKVDLDQAAKMLASIRGVTLGIRVTERLYGAIKVDFREDVTALNPVAIPLMLEILGDAGMMVEDFQSWSGEAKGNQVTIEGVMTAPCVRQVLSLVDTSFVHMSPPPKAKTPGGEAGTEQSQEYLVLAASEQYFQNVTRMMDDFKYKKKHRQSIGQMATWMERYAEKINRLPMLNVDTQLLDYGTYVADQLRGGSSSIRGAARTTRAESSQAGQSTGVSQRISNAGYGGGYGYGGYPGYGGYGAYGFARYGMGYGMGGYHNVGRWWGAGQAMAAGAQRTELRQQQQIKTQLRVQLNNASNSAAQSTLQNIDQATEEVRRAMTDKYKVEFNMGSEGTKPKAAGG